MIELPDVESLFDDGLGEWLDSQGDARAETKRKSLKITVIGTVAAVIVGIIAGMLEAGSFAFFIGGIVWTGALAYAARIRKKMINHLKQEMNGALAKTLDIDYSVNAFPGAEFKTARDAGLLPSYDNSKFEDQWHGKMGDTDFLMYEAKLTEQRGSGKNRRTVTVFRGIILRFQFARSFLGTTLLRRDGFKFSLFGIGETAKVNGQKLERVKMVDPRFEDAFDLYSNDQVEARYIVHPAYCERLIEMEGKFSGAKSCALFLEGDMIITMRATDMFESASLNPQSDRHRLQTTIEQFASMAQLVKMLNERPRG